MVFKAKASDLKNPKEIFGAYIDIEHGLIANHQYEIQCKVSSGKNSTIGFQLWIHDGNSFGPEVKEPILPQTPPAYYTSIKTIYTASKTERMRIYFLCKPGEGIIFISEFTVHELNVPPIDLSKI